MRPSETDHLLIRYIAAREARYAIPSPRALSLTGSVSACCRAETFERNFRLFCFACRQPCGERLWRAPKSGTVSRGGWTAQVDGDGETTSKILVRETRTVRGDSEDQRRAIAWDQFADLEPLFARPAHATQPWWDRLMT
ncbi:MAG: hypothetical protein WA001_03640, partial [Patescibacteria group bacterium]